MTTRTPIILRDPSAAHKHGRVGRSRPALRDFLTMLCVGIALVFAGASAASVVDGVQHVAKTPHEHRLSLTATGDTHHQEQDDDGHHPQDDAAAGDLHTGPGHHHHSEPPAAPLAALDAAIYLTTAAMHVRTDAAGSKVQGVRPGGLERPPRSASIDA
jgi:hypothetical protein